MHLVAIGVAGLVIGALFGLFGVGGSSFATPILSLLGLSGFAAVASPLPATLPAAFVGARQYARFDEVDGEVARWSLIGGVPATIVGALLSRLVGGPALLVASGIVLGVIGVRVLRPISAATIAAGSRAASQSGARHRDRGRRWIVHGTPRQRRRLPARPRVPARTRAFHAHGIGNEPRRDRRPHDPDARHALGPRPHRLARRHGICTRFGAGVVADESPGPTHQRRAPPTRVRRVAHRVLDRFRHLPPFRQLGAIT